MNNRLHILFLSIKIVLGLVLVLLLLGRSAPVQADFVNSMAGMNGSIDPYSEQGTDYQYISAEGILTYYDRNDALVFGRNTTVYLFDEDNNSDDDLLATTIANEYGYFRFDWIPNYDLDEYYFPSDPRLDLYAVYYSQDLEIQQMVTNFNVEPYSWQSETVYDVSDNSTADLSMTIPFFEETESAMWIYEDLLRAYEYMFNNGIDPGGVTAFWEYSQEVHLPCLGSCFYGDPNYWYVFIAHRHTYSSDYVVHEVAHNYLWNQTGYWLYWDAGCFHHEVFTEEDEVCAWYEGWADFIPLIVNGDTCYDSDNIICSGYDIEDHGYYDSSEYDRGDRVEGRVAGMLYDLFDNENEDFDSTTFGLIPITEVVFQEPLEQTSLYYWGNWQDAGHNKHNSVQTFYQNTIDYDYPPIFNPDLPDRSVLLNHGWSNAIDLWEYSADAESDDWELNWQMINSSNPGCGVSIDAEDYVNIFPQAGFLGSCDITIQVSDSLKTTEDTFRVTVLPIQARVYLPLITFSGN
ncbi:MAG: hypothetical protein WA110_06135 [Anaerolineaceae bacterium]